MPNATTDKKPVKKSAKQDAPKPEAAPVPEAAPTINPVLSPEHRRILDSREALKHPLPADQAFFEAPDGFIMVGEKSHDRAFYRQGNHGKGMWINPRRA